LMKVFKCFSVIRYVAIRSISAGGQPCRVDSVMELETLELMLRIYSSSTFLNSFTCSNAQLMHSLKTSVSFASIMSLMYLSTFGDLMPSRS